LAIYARLRLQALSNVEILTPAQPGMWGGILSFRSKQMAAAELSLRLKRSNRIITTALAHPASEHGPEYSAVRACFHIYNSHDDVERLVRALQ
jgi:selenocysteine lyase/cysteine desulfurase